MRHPPLIAVAHGSRDPRAAATVHALMDQVRLARPDIDVHAAFLDHAAPSLGQVLRRIEPPGECVVLPLLLTAAYHSKVDIPGVLQDVGARGHRITPRYGQTLGPDPKILDVLERRLADEGVEAGDPDTAVVLVSAGSSDVRANAVIATMAREWARRGWRAVIPAYASAADPRPGEAVARLRAAGVPRAAVAPYLLAPGFFADRVRDTALSAGADVVAGVLGDAPEVAELLLRRYGEALAEPEAATA